MSNKNVPGNGFLVRLTHLREQNETIRGYNSYTRNCPKYIGSYYHCYTKFKNF